MWLSFIYPAVLWLLVLIPALWTLALVLPRRLPPVRFYASLGLRSALIALLVLSLAGTQLVQPVDRLTTVFLIDSSDSVSASARGQAETFVAEALEHMRPGDQAAVVVFGENALVERSPSDEPGLGRIASVPGGARTDIQEALQLGLALLPADSQKRIVLLSDGGENAGRAATAAQLAEARGIPIEIYSLASPSNAPEALVERLEAPTHIRDGQELVLTAEVESSVQQQARIRFFADDQLIPGYDREVTLQPGVNRFEVRVPAQGQGFVRYRVQIEPTTDARPQNNEAAALVQIQGPPRILLVEGQPGDAAALAAGLQAAQVQAEIVAPGNMPSDLPGLSNYEAVVLVNVPARDLPVRAMDALPRYVRDLGKGLIMVGGEESYGVGGYGRTPIEEALPVYMDVRDREQRPNLALVFIVDRSGSMDACHCTGPDRQSAQLREGGVPKVDIAKEAIAQAARLLGPDDSIGVVAFNEHADWVLPVTRGAEPLAVQDAIGPVIAEGSTNVRAGLAAARDALLQTDARIKHAILLTDGWSTGGDNLDIAEEMRADGITLSVVAAGGGSAQYLENLATTGGGRYYAAAEMSEVPQIFVNETIRAVGNYIIERPFVPALVAESPVFAGIDALPALYGFNGTTLKDSARVVLAADDGSPVLAQWQYGLGRSIAWTSDVKGRWALDWVRWEQFPRFAAQLTGWVLPARATQQVNSELRVEDGQAFIDVTVQDEQGRPREDLALQAALVAVNGDSQQITLQQVAPGQYRAAIASPAPGTYLVQIAGASEGRVVVQDTAGLVVPYSPEYRQGQSNLLLLEELARLTAGRVVSEPAQAFDRLASAVFRAQEIALPLLLLALLLWPVDIATRRLFLKPQDLAALRPSRRPRVPPPPDPTLARLSQARARVRAEQHPPPAAPPREQPPAAGRAARNRESMRRRREAATGRPALHSSGWQQLEHLGQLRQAHWLGQEAVGPHR